MQRAGVHAGVHVREGGAGEGGRESVCELVLPSICARSLSVIACGCVRGLTPRLAFVSVCVVPPPSC